MQQEVAQSRFELEGNQALNELGKLEAKASELRATLKGAKKGTDEYIQANKGLTQVNKQIDETRQKLGLQGMTYKQLSSLQRELTREMKNSATAGTEAYAKLQAKLRDVNEEMGKQKANFSQTRSTFDAMKATVGGAALGTFTGNIVSDIMQKVVSVIPNYVSSMKQVADQQANVAKTTGLTEREIAALEKKMGEFNTRTSREELRSLAAEAGKLGREGVEDVAKFVKEADIIGVALKADLGEDAVVTIAKAADAYEEGMLNIASGINEVGASSAATERYQVDFLERMTGIAKTANLSAASVMGYASALEVNGVQAETASTALSQFFIDFVKNSDKFEKAAGMQAGSLKKLLQDEGVNAAFVKFLENMKEGSKGTKDMLQKLEDLGIDGARGAQTFLVLANNTKTLREQQEIANKAIKEGTSVVNEFNKNNENFAGNLEKIGKWISKAFRFDQINQGVKDLTANFAKMLEVPVSEQLQAEARTLEELRIKILSTKVGTQERTKAIQELQAKYPDYLGNLDAERASNEDVSRAIDKVTGSLAARIVIQRQQEKIQQVAEEQADIMQALLEREAQMVKSLTSIYNGSAKAKAERDKMFAKRSPDVFTQAQVVLANQQAFGLNKYNGYLMRLQQLMNEVKPLEEERSKAVLKGLDLEAEKLRIMKSLGVDLTTPTAPPSKRDKPVKTETTGTTDPKQAKADAKQQAEYERAKAELQKHLDEIDAILEQNDIKRELSSLEKRDKERAELDNEFEAKREKIQQYLGQALTDENLSREQKIQAEVDFNSQMLDLDMQQRLARKALEEQYALEDAEKKAAAEEAIKLATMSKDEAEIEQIREKYRKLIAQGEQYGIDTLALYRAMDDEIQAFRKKADAKELADEKKQDQALLQQKRRQAQMEAEVVGSYFDVVNSLTQLNLDNSAEAAKFKATMALFEIMVNQGVAISSAVATATPGDPYTVAGRIAAAVAAVVAGTVNAIMAWKKAGEAPSAPQLAGRYFGGETGSGSGRNPSDQYGEIVGYHHANEYVVPSFIRTNPGTINATAVTETLRRDAIRMGRTVSSTGAPEFGPGTSSGSTEMLMMEMLREMRAQKEKPVVFVATEYERFLEEQRKIMFTS